MTQKLLSVLCLAACVAAPAFAADVAPAADGGGPKIAFGATADVVSSYIFRGYEVTDSGLIFQPGVTATMEIPDSPVSIHLGNWNSIQTYDDKGLTSDQSVWFEADAIAGVTVALPKDFSVDLSYVGYFYPSEDVDNIHELDLAVNTPTINIGDTKATLNFGALFAFEFAKESNDRNNSYMELHGALGLPPVVDGVSFSIPVAVGFSLDNYYTKANGDNAFFGYVQTGLEASGDIAAVQGLSWHAGVYGVFGNKEVVLNDTASDSAMFAKAGVSYNF